MQLKLIALAAGLLGALPAAAQEQTAAPPTPAEEVVADDRTGDFAIVGIGVGVLPDYEGSDDYALSPVPAAIGQVSGFRFLLAGNRVSVDLVRDGVGPTWDVQAGPIGVVNFNRGSADAIDEPQVALLDERGTAIELGGYVGLGKTGVVTSDYDRLSFTVSYRHDVSDVHDSGIWAPTLSYATPLSTKALVGLFLSAEHVGDGYGRAYFSVTPAESLRSGLPVYDAEGGWKNWTIGLAATHSLTGDLTNGLQLVAGGTYRRMLGDYGDSPLTDLVGSRGQWLGAVGLAYSF